MGVRHSREQWLLWVVDQRSSGMTIGSFCDSVGIKENSFYRWRARLTAEGALFEGRVVSRDVSPFVPLAVVEPTNHPSIEVDLPCGAVVRVPPGDAAIEQVLRVLLDVGREGGAAC